MNKKKILLVQLFSNGDCLYATAVAKQIKKDFPDCNLIWAVSGLCKNIIEGNPYIDEILVVNEVTKNDVAAFRKYKRKIKIQQEQGIWDKVFITHIMDTNQAYYDGCIRSGILRAYQKLITVDITPVLRCTEEEKIRVKQFVQHQLEKYKHVILFEFAPQSGQSVITKEFAVAVAENLTALENVAVILSSGISISHTNNAIIDGSVLSLKETALLTHHCTLLLGCSSGITWISTSDAAQKLPMVQLLNANTTWINPVSRDFERFGMSTDTVIEMIEFDVEKTTACCKKIITENFAAAKSIYHQKIPLHFKTTKNIVYNLVCYAEFGAIKKHFLINIGQYGYNFSFLMEFLSGFLIFPFRLVYNIITKKILKTKPAY